MHLKLIGADLEENLGVGMVAAACHAAGHRVSFLAFNGTHETPTVVAAALELQPQVVGLSMQFQHRAVEFLGLVAALRKAGYAGHISCGGQFPSVAYRELLLNEPGIDSVVMHEGETSVPALLDALAKGSDLRGVAGLAIRNSDHDVELTAPQSLANDLDALPFPLRYRAHDRHLGIPFIPILGSRGCWGSCSFCSITTFYRNARQCSGGDLMRLRSPANIADEMAELWRAAGESPAIFCFHDDNLLLPKPAASLERFETLRRELDRRGVGQVAIVGKCRPDTLTPELALRLAELGVVRLYVGVENASHRGCAHLNRRMQATHAIAALKACNRADIFACYNLLLFEPEATLDDVAANIEFIQQNPAFPVNFCRAEPYVGTPLQRSMAAQTRLTGSFLGFDYRMGDDRTELLFRICAAAFRSRNFAANGVHNRYMGLGYYAKLIEHFYNRQPGRRAHLAHHADQLMRSITAETASFLEQALELARSEAVGNHERIARKTADLGLRIAAADAKQHARLDQLYADFQLFIENDRELPNQRVHAAWPKVFGQVARGAALTTWIAAASGGMSGCARSMSADPVPSDAGYNASKDTGTDAANRDAAAASDAQKRLDSKIQELDLLIVDPPPYDSPLSVDQNQPPQDAGAKIPQASLIDRWSDTTPKRPQRSADVALFEPLDVSLRAHHDSDGLCVELGGHPGPLSIRWQADGQVKGRGRRVHWEPASSASQITAAVRSRGGLAIVSLRAKDVSV